MRSFVQFLALAALVSCRSAGQSSAIGRHLETPVWMGALERQTEDPAQWVPTLAFAAVAPLVAFYDDDLSRRARKNRFTGGVSGGDAVSLALGGGALIYGGLDWARGDQGQSFEVAAECILATGAVTETLKWITQRTRPDGSATHSSFPSGHTSFAFAGATFLAREIEAETGSELGYALFLPAAFVAFNRVDTGRHWASDAAAGAAIGVFLTNWIYNAHFPEQSKPRPTIFADRHTFSLRVAPAMIDDRLALVISVSI